MFWFLIVAAVIFTVVPAIIGLAMRYRYGPEEAERRFLKHYEEELSDMGKGFTKKPKKGRWFE